MDALNRRLTRRQIAEFIPDHRGIVAFENLQQDASTTAEIVATGPFVTVDPDADLPESRILAGSDNISVTDGGAGAEVSLDLTDTTIAPDIYGSATRIPVLTFDAKGRATDGQEVKIDVSDVDGTLSAAHGGTGQSSYTVGDILYANGAASLARLADVATGNVLLSGGVATAPLWGPVDLTIHVTGILPIANGGTGTASAGYTGDIVVGAQTLHFVNGFLASVT